MKTARPTPGAQLPPPAAVSPRMIPPPPGDFVGRANELAELGNKVESGAAVLGLAGLAGVGRTALALKLAESLAARAPDAQLHVDLRGSAEECALSPAAALEHVLRPYYPDSPLPEDEAELAGLYQAVLRGKRALVVADDARDAAQVAALVPPAGGVLITTSREGLKLPGILAKYLNPLRPADARALLAKAAPRAGDQAEDISKQCGCLPFVLRLAGWAFAERLEIDPEDYARQLTGARKGGSLADAALGLTTGLLSADGRKLWHALVVFPGDFDAAAATAMGGLAPKAAGAALAELAKAGLVERAGPGAERFRLHELARAFAAARAEDSERADGRLRHAVYFMAVLRKADKLCAEGGDGSRRGRELLDREWANLRAAQAWTAAHAGGDETLAHLCNEFPAAGANCLGRRQCPPERLRWLESALRAARRLKLRAAESAHLIELGTLYAELGELHRAVEYYGQYLAVARELGDRRNECVILGRVAAAWTALEDPGRAAECYGQLLAAAGALGDRKVECGALGNLGLASAALGDHRRAREFHERHLAAARELGDRRAECTALGNLGTAWAALNEPGRAAECCERQLAVSRELGDERAEGVALANLSAVAGLLGEPRRAIALHEQHLAFARRAGDRRAECAALGAIAAACHALGEHARAAEFYERQAAAARELGDGRAECAALGNQAVAWRSAGDHRKALELGERHLAAARAAGDRRAESAALAGLGASRLALEEPGRTAELFEQHLAVVRSTEGLAAAPATLGSLGTAYLQTGDARRAAECYEQQLAAARAAGDRRAEGNALFNLSLALDRLGDRPGAVERAKAALSAFRAIGDANAARAREQLDRWAGKTPK